MSQDDIGELINKEKKRRNDTVERNSNVGLDPRTQRKKKKKASPGLMSSIKRRLFGGA